MRNLILSSFALAIVSGCQIDKGLPDTGPVAAEITGPAASAIAGDIAGRLAEQAGDTSKAAIQVENGSSEFATVLEASLKGWGYTIVSGQVEGGQRAPIKLAYAIETIDGLVLASVSTPSIALGRAYQVNETGATPASPLSVIRRNW